MMGNIKPSILLVDDSKIQLNYYRKLLSVDYELIYAESGEQALELIQKEPDLILLDVMMPGINGYETCKRIEQQESYRHIPIIFMTGLQETDDETKGLNLGAVDYLKKSTQPEIVRARVKTHIELVKATRELERKNALLTEDVAKRTQQLRETQQEILLSLGIASEYRDPETGSHLLRMSHYSEVLARAYGLKEYQCELILHASPMHDVGKIGIPDRALLKPGKLDAEEWEIMKTHAPIGALILADGNSEVLDVAWEIALCHHEKWDGSGYPEGLIGEDIPLFGRIVAVADVFDALTTKRPYKEAWSVADAVEEIKRTSGSHFDPKLVEVFEAILPELLTIRDRFPEQS